jgi:hypothetical protein
MGVRVVVSGAGDTSTEVSASIAMPRTLRALREQDRHLTNGLAAPTIHSTVDAGGAYRIDGAILLSPPAVNGYIFFSLPRLAQAGTSPLSAWPAFARLRRRVGVFGAASSPAPSSTSGAVECLKSSGLPASVVPEAGWAGRPRSGIPSTFQGQSGFE